MGNNDLEQLYSQYKAQIYSLCIKLTMSKEFSEDLFSDTWIRVAEKLEQLDPEQNTFNWIYTICLNLYRKQKRKRAFIQFFSDQTHVSDIIPSPENTEEQYIEREQSFQLNVALKKLNDKYRIPLILFYYKELSYQDIAEIMHLPMSTVKYRLNQAKKILKTELEKYRYE